MVERSLLERATVWVLFAFRLPLAVVFVSSVPTTACLSDRLLPSVLQLDQSGPGLLTYNAISHVLRARLLASPMRDVVIYHENLDLDRFHGGPYLALLSGFIREKYRERPVGIILAVGSRALEQAIVLRTGAWAELPIAFVAVPDSAIDRSKIPPNVSGVTIKLSLATMLETAKALVPNLSTVVLVGDPLEQQAFRWHFEKELPLSDPKLKLIDLLGHPLEEVKRRVAALPADAAILYTSISGHGSLVTPALAFEEIAAVANRPIVVDVETYIGRGAVGGFVIGPAGLGEAAAELVMRILKGESASKIPIEMGESVAPVFDWRQLRRWGINEAQLPRGSVLRFRELTFFERYRWRAMLVGTAIVLQSFLIIALLRENRRRRKAETDSRAFLAELTHFDRVATAGVLAASIAHEIRQPLTAVTSHASATLRRLSKDPPEIGKARRALEIIVEEGHRASDVIAGMRTLFRSKNVSSRTTTIRVNDIIREVVTVLAGELKRHKIELTMELTGDPAPRVRGIEIQLRQVILNLMMNAIEVLGKAVTGPRQLQIESKVQSGRNVLIVVKDSGPGIAADALDQIFQPFFTTKEDGMGMGLSICRSIVEAHGGHITADSIEGEGAVFRIFLPYSGPDDKVL